MSMTFVASNYFQEHIYNQVNMSLRMRSFFGLSVCRHQIQSKMIYHFQCRHFNKDFSLEVQLKFQQISFLSNIFHSQSVPSACR